DATGVATNIYIGVRQPLQSCQSDAECGANQAGACDLSTNLCWQAIDPTASYELATSDYLAGGGSGFRVLKRNTTQFNTGVQQRDALTDYLRAGKPCGSDDEGKLLGCSVDADCGSVGPDFVCACPATADEQAGVCVTDPAGSCAP